MKKDIHPNYGPVLFEDTGTGAKFIINSTIESKETKKHEGKEYPYVRLTISSASHPFYTGDQKFVDTEGRVDKFLKRYKSPQAKKEEAAKKEAAASANGDAKDEKKKPAKATAPKTPAKAKASAKKPAEKKAPAKKAPAKKDA